jgi:hypothetical protein
MPEYPAIVHDHGDLREELSSFLQVLAADACPPPGHAFHAVLDSVAGYFAHELPEHVAEEEALVYPDVPPAQLARLREQHQAMLVMAGMFSRQHQTFTQAPTERAWTELRHIGKRLSEAVRQHLDYEEAVLAHAARARR